VPGAEVGKNDLGELLERQQPSEQVELLRRALAAFRLPREPVAGMLFVEPAILLLGHGASNLIDRPCRTMLR